MTYLKSLLILILITLHTTSCTKQDKKIKNRPKDNEAFFFEQATFAGGMFWYLDYIFNNTPGIIKVRTGFIGGDKKTAELDQVLKGNTQHLLAVNIQYDPILVDYETLTRIFFQHIDPTDPGGQFKDRGRHFRSAIFYHSVEQKNDATGIKEKLNNASIFPAKIITSILPATTFYPANEINQKVYSKSPTKYKLYILNSGRNQFFQRIRQRIKDLQIKLQKKGEGEKEEGKNKKSHSK